MSTPIIILGKNLRNIRRLRGFSADQLSNRILEVRGVNISADAIRRWERGERAMSIDDAVHLICALDCSLQTLMDGVDPRMGEVKETRKEISRLRPEDHKIMRYIATDWNGNVHALVIANGIYAAVPKKYRREIIMEVISQMDAALRAGDVCADDLPAGLAYMEEQLGRLYAEDDA